MFVSIRSFEFSNEVLQAICQHVKSMIQSGTTGDLRYDLSKHILSQPNSPSTQ
jgi:hypothetical protein